MGFKSIYSSQWAKAVKNCEKVITDLSDSFSKKGLTLRAGHGALSDRPLSDEHDSGEPDIFLLYNDRIIGGVEVTGSAFVNWPCEVWIGEHKQDYTRKVFFPVVFVLFYKNDTRFVTAKMVERYAPIAEKRTLYGGIEYYHCLRPDQTHSYKELFAFVEGLLDCAKLQGSEG